ncbi:MAG: ABC transporter ATP-binding protein [Xanthomonadaceae bacterium]|nr:ABC transporter ATP-binding protein [Xanthomonadaceae bacterium]
MLLEVNNLKTWLRAGKETVHAVEDVSFRIDRGETFCLVGESGSGKSVSALSVIQLLPPDITQHPGGEILFDYRHPDGRHERVDMLSLPEERRRAIRGSRIAMIFQEAQMAQRLAVMRLGKIVESGPVRQVLSQPAHAYTRQLIDALPENLRRRRVTEVRPAVEAGRATDPGEVLVRVEDFRIHFPVRKGLLRRVVDHVRAVDGVSLDIRRGQVLALVGESGCGKTTLGRGILRLLEATSGSIQFQGDDITRLSRRELRPFRRRMQIIFQDPASSLNPRLTVAEALTEPMAVHGIGASHEERLALAQAVIEQVQLPPDSLWRYPHEFSGGQRQRIGIARALVLNPSFIVCDEVTSALDVSVQAEILQILQALKEERGLTLLFITHNMGVVEYLADSMAVMYQGKVVEYGPTDRVCRQPENDYTRRLLAAVPRLDLAALA